MVTVAALRASLNLRFSRKSCALRSASLLLAGLAFVVAGCGGGGTPTSTAPPAASPTFSPAGGSFSSAQSVTLADATAGATIYYTTDGSSPTTASTKYSTAVTVGSTQTISAIAAAANYSNSAVAAATYTIVLPAAAAPTFSPAAGSYVGAQTITLADATPRRSRLLHHRRLHADRKLHALCGCLYDQRDDDRERRCGGCRLLQQRRGFRRVRDYVAAGGCSYLLSGAGHLQQCADRYAG